MVCTFSRIWINRVWLPILLVVSSTGKNVLFFPVSVRAREFRLARWAWQSRLASAWPFSTLRLNVVLTHGILPAFSDGVHIYRQPPSGQSRVYRVTQLRTDGVHCRESTGTGPVVPKKVPVTGAAFSGVTMAIFFYGSLFSHTTYCIINSTKWRPLVWESIVGGNCDGSSAL